MNLWEFSPPCSETVPSATLSFFSWSTQWSSRKWTFTGRCLNIFLYRQQNHSICLPSCSISLSVTLNINWNSFVNSKTYYVFGIPWSILACSTTNILSLRSVKHLDRNKTNGLTLLRFRNRGEYTFISVRSWVISPDRRAPSLLLTL